MSETIGLVGIDFERANALVRSHFAFSDTQKIDFSTGLLEVGCSECVILSTCNRSEVYYVSRPGFAPDLIRLLLQEEENKAYADCFYALEGNEAAKHLMHVTAGLKSAVLGEDQILGQVSRACEFAETVGTAGKTLSKLFQTAVTTAKRIKTETGMSNLPLSASYIGIKKLGELLGGLEGRQFMLIGAGEMNRLAARYLSEGRAGRILLCTRSCTPAEGWDIPVEPLPFTDRYSRLSEMDAVICATASPHTVLTAESMPPLHKPLCIVDMAMPPDVDEHVALMDQVTVISIDDLRTAADENLERRRQLSEQAERTISEDLEKFNDWLFRSRVDPAIESLNRRCDAIAEDTEAYLFHKLELTPKEKKLITKMLRAGLHRLIREPVLCLKALESENQQDEYINMVKELFDL